MPLYSFKGCSNNPVATPPLSHIRYLPTNPLELASPCGNRFDFDSSSSLRSFRAIGAQHHCLRPLKDLAPARIEIDARRSPGHASSARSCARSIRPDFAAPRLFRHGITLTNVLDFARISQPNGSQNPQFTQAAAPLIRLRKDRHRRRETDAAQASSSPARTGHPKISPAWAAADTASTAEPRTDSRRQARDAQIIFGFRVVRLQVRIRDRPICQRRARHFAVKAALVEIALVKPPVIRSEVNDSAANLPPVLDRLASAGLSPLPTCER